MALRGESWRSVVAAFAEVEVIAPWLLRMPLRTPTLPPATQTNHYLLGDGDLLVIDPATPHKDSQARLIALLEGLIGAGRRPVGLLLTHHHGDHVGAATALADHLQVPILAHAETARLLKDEVAVDRLLSGGERVLSCSDGRHWQVLHTPGHAPGHLIVSDGRSGLIAGDMVAGEGTVLVDPDEGSMADYLASLERMRSLKPKWLAPAHGPLIHDADGLLLHYLEHRRAREERVLDALKKDWQPDDALLPTAYADTPRLLWPFALRSLRAHLLHLQEQGLVERSAHRWRRT